MRLLYSIALSIVTKADAVHDYKNNWPIKIQLAHGYSIASWYNNYMSVRDYYLEHFNELPLEKQKHFATRMKYWFKDAQFDDFLAANEPSHDLVAVLANNDYSGVNNLEARRPFFEKYPELYGLEACLFRINRLLIEYGVDLREEFLKEFPREKLYGLCDNLMNDSDALAILSTYAVNVICLVENLFPRNDGIYNALTRRYLHAGQRPEFIYAYTHIILCMSDFYTKEIRGEDEDLAQLMLANCEQLITDHFDTTTLDTKLEYLVCAEIAHYRNEELRKKIDEECRAARENSPYVVDARKSEKYNTLAGAEHRNVLYIMSGLDY